MYRAWDLQLARPVALKVVSEALSQDAAALILREARAAARLAHPGAVTVYDALEIDGVPVLAMELVEGRSLRAALREEVSLELRIHWLAQIADVLNEAHRLGLVHRDIKPENVMVRPDGTIKVLDFGIARWDAGDAMTIPGPTSHPERVKGTLKYMAPEQMRSEPLDGRSDQYAWGVMAYEVLAKVHPVMTAPEISTVEFVQNRHPPPLHELAPAVPFTVSAVVTRAMAKERDARFGSMAEVATALREAVTITGPVAPRTSQQDAIATAVYRPSAPAPFPPAPYVTTGPRANAPAAPSRSSPWPWIIAVGAGLLLLVGLGIAGSAAWWVSREHETTSPPADGGSAVVLAAADASVPVATLAVSEDAAVRPVATRGPTGARTVARPDAGATAPVQSATTPQVVASTPPPPATTALPPPPRPAGPPRTLRFTGMNTFFNYEPRFDPPALLALVAGRKPAVLNCYTSSFDDAGHPHDFSVTYELHFDASGRVNRVISSAPMYTPLLQCVAGALMGIVFGPPTPQPPPYDNMVYLFVRYD